MSRLTQHPLKSRIAGFDVFLALLGLANRQSKKYFYTELSKTCLTPF